MKPSVLRSLICAAALVASSGSQLPGAHATGAACPAACTTEYNPVCGSDGKTYSNKCALSSVQCSKNPSLTITASGECPASGTSAPGPTIVSPSPSPSPSPSSSPSPSGSAVACNQLVACPAMYAPVCGSDGKTYGNDCDLRFAQCSNTKLTLASNGECSSGSSSGGGGSGGGPNGGDIKVLPPAGSSSTADPSDAGATTAPQTKSGVGTSTSISAAALAVATTSVLYLVAFAA